MKKLIFLFSCFIAIAAMASCKNNNPSDPSPADTMTATATITDTYTISQTHTITQTHTVSPTITVTPTITQSATNTPTVLLNIVVYICRENLTPKVVAYVSADSAAYSTAEIKVEGTPIPFVVNVGSQSLYQLNDTIPYTYGHSYAVSVSAFGMTASDTSAPAPGDISTAADGSSVTWAYDGNADYVALYYTNLTFIKSYIEDQDSPLTIDNSAYPGNGNFLIYVRPRSNKYTDMGNPNLINSSISNIAVYEQRYIEITR